MPAVSDVESSSGPRNQRSSRRPQRIGQVDQAGEQQQARNVTTKPRMLMKAPMSSEAEQDGEAPAEQPAQLQVFLLASR